MLKAPGVPPGWGTASGMLLGLVLSVLPFGRDTECLWPLHAER